MVNVNGVSFGGNLVPVIAGPCSIESQSQFLTIAKELKTLPVKFLRGGLHKLRTNPESFQGLGAEGYEIAKIVCKEVDFSLVTEVTNPKQITALSEITCLFQVGTRSMYNYDLLKELGSQPIPVLLKRGFSATYEELLKAAEYIISQGNQNVILCERGIRTFVKETRNTFDINAIPYLKQKSHLPVVADPSHGAGLTPLVTPVALAALAAGADGLLIEIHNRPDEALSDGQQALTPPQLKKLLEQGEGILSTLGRGFA